MPPHQPPPFPLSSIPEPRVSAERPRLCVVILHLCTPGVPCFPVQCAVPMLSRECAPLAHLYHHYVRVSRSPACACSVILFAAPVCQGRNVFVLCSLLYLSRLEVTIVLRLGGGEGHSAAGQQRLGRRERGRALRLEQVLLRWSMVAGNGTQERSKDGRMRERGKKQWRF